MSKNNISKLKLEELYLYDGMSTREIADHTGTTRGHVEHLLEKYKIPRRTVSEAHLLQSEKLKEIKIEEEIVRNLLNKYRISKLLTVNTDISTLEQRKLGLQNNLKDLDNFVVNQYRPKK